MKNTHTCQQCHNVITSKVNACPICGKHIPPDKQDYDTDDKKIDPRLVQYARIREELDQFTGLEENIRSLQIDKDKALTQISSINRKIKDFEEQLYNLRETQKDISDPTILKKILLRFRRLLGGSTDATPNINLIN